jgi:hypothetical protein
MLSTIPEERTSGIAAKMEPKTSPKTCDLETLLHSDACDASADLCCSADAGSAGQADARATGPGTRQRSYDA